MTRLRRLAATAWNCARTRVRWRGLVPVVLFGLSILFSVHYYQAEQAAQHAQGAVLEQRLCTSLGRLAALRPPAGDPADNPSRAFDQKLIGTLAELGPDVGCRP